MSVTIHGVEVAESDLIFHAAVNEARRNCPGSDGLASAATVLSMVVSGILYGSEFQRQYWRKRAHNLTQAGADYMAEVGAYHG